MEKLLHERLRDVIEEAGSEGVEDVDICAGNAQVSLYVDGAAALADEIARYYIPRPRFEDGEPVQFGDEAQVRDDLGEVCKMVFNEGGCEEVMIGFEYDSSASHYMVVDGELVKRPAPKVLDADGVSICKGDTVWHITSGEKYTVYKVDGEDGGIFIEGCCSIFSGVEFTHREPDSLEKLQDLISAIDNVHGGSSTELHLQLDKAYDMCTALIERGA